MFDLFKVLCSLRFGLVFVSKCKYAYFTFYLKVKSSTLFAPHGPLAVGLVSALRKRCSFTVLAL